jgi:hypothetical protein
MGVFSHCDHAVGQCQVNRKERCNEWKETTNPFYGFGQRLDTTRLMFSARP